ncbi:hypothetical protein BH11PSE8_BH11PSE8_19620 [soil metagenome]
MNDSLHKPGPRATTARDRVTPEDLDVSPALLGLRLARPGRRAMAMAVDLLVVGLLSSLGPHHLFSSRVGDDSGVTVVGPDGVRKLVMDDDEDEVADAAPRKPVAQSASAPTAVAVAASGAASASSQEIAAALALRVATLEAELAAAKKPRRFRPQAELRRWLRGLGVGFGWAAVYFSLLPAWWNGQTVGKRLFSLRVVELTGKPMTVLRCLKRYGGYAAGMATGLLGFAQVFWDSNRQAIQDKTAHTVVIDLRGLRGSED